VITRNGKAQERKILVVEDLLYVVKCIERILKEEGYVVHTALSGEEALERVGKIKPDIITIDHRLPDMTGFGLIREIHNLMGKNKLRIIYISAVYERETIETALGLGVNSYLIKPVERERLLATVREVLKD
jgi:DNA-binding response OmpR family regulator